MPGGTDMRASRPSTVRAVECALWLSVITLIALLQGFGQHDHRLNLVAAVVSIVFGIRSFVGHGGALVTVLGLFNYALALFVGIGGAYAATDGRLDPHYLGMAILAGLTFQILTTFIGWRGQPVDAPVTLPDVDATRWVTRWGVLALLILTVWRQTNLGTRFDGLTEASAFAAVTLLTIGFLFREDARLVSGRSLVVLAALAVYVEVFHTGGGRLRIVALACVVGIIASMRFRKRALKWAAVLATPLMLVYLARQRLEFQEMLSAGASEGRNGLESMLVPIAALTRLLQEQAEGFPLAWGWNLLSMPLSFLPESWLPNAPQALGYELVAVYAPSRYGSGYSTAATAAGEAVYNFGLLGILLGAPVIAWLCNLIDKMIRRQATGDIADDRVHIIRLALWVSVGGAIADLAWNGWHVYVVRTLLRLPLLGGLAVVALMGRALSRRKQKPSRVLFHTAQR